MVKTYEWEITKSGPIYGVIIVSKGKKDLFPPTSGDKVTKRSSEFNLKYQGGVYPVFLEQVKDSSFRIWGIRGKLKELYKQLGVLTDDYYKTGGTIRITKENGEYSVEYDPKNEKTVYTDESIEEEPVEIPKSESKEERTSRLFAHYRKEGQIEFVTFHPSYSYEDFIEGIRPDLEKDKPTFNYYEGIFKKICLKALNALIKYLNEQGYGEVFRLESWKDFEKAYPVLNKVLKKVKIDEMDSKINHVLIIDEINRGDISKIFGELVTLVEPDKRLGAKYPLPTKLPYTNNLFCVPPNLYIVGTMNTADRSLALVDIALRRRFDFEEMAPELEKLRDNPEEFGCEKIKDEEIFKNSIAAVIKLNEKLGADEDITKDKKIGHAFFCNLEKKEEVYSVWRNKIMPLLEEYYFFDRNELEKLSDKTYTFRDGWKKGDEDVKNFINLLIKPGE